jgi:hypothetical protein
VSRECLLALSITFLLGTRFGTLTNGVLALGLQGVAFMGGWLELSFSPFANVSIPSGPAVAYAGVLLVVIVSVAMRQFGRRDL